MHTTWRVSATIGLLGVGSLLALLLAAGSPLVRQEPLPTLLPWLLALLFALGAAGVWQHLRDLRTFRRQLAIGLTHHLRTSLAHIQAYNEMLLMGSETSEEQRVQWLEIVGRESERLRAAVDNVLVLVRDTRSDPYPIRRSVDLGALLEDVACDYSTASMPEIRFEGGPPPGIMVQADPAALRHALGNLIHGIGSCCNPGGRLCAALSTDGATATVRVGLIGGTTAGSGFSGKQSLREEDLEGETGAGFGLEMAVVQHVARAHGGRASPYHETDRTGYRLDLPIAGA